MRAISLWEPWATAIAIGAKQIETRGWGTDFRGPLAIHAAKTRDHTDALFYSSAQAWDAFTAAGIRGSAQLSFGCVVATCRIVACIRTEDLLSSGRVKEGSLEHDLGGYEPGRFGWILEDVQRLPTPIPARGAQNFWNWTPPV